MEWSDIRIFLQVARDGTMLAASGALRMDHTTISRRISRLEEQTRVRLFDRAGRRLSLTSEGEKLLRAAERLDSIVVRDVLNLRDEGERIVGPVRIGTTEDFGAHYLAPRMAALTSAHPGIEIELVALPRSFSLAAREVDLLVSLDRPIAGDIRYKKLTDVEFGIYAGSSYFEARPRPGAMDDLAGETWCGYIKELLASPALDMLPFEETVPARYRTTSSTVQLAAVKSGYALAALPCFVASTVSGLERVLPDRAIFERSYWLAVHQDLAQYPRVRALMSAIEAEVAQDRALFRPSAVAAATAARPAATILRWLEPQNVAPDAVLPGRMAAGAVQPARARNA
ncbi:LysR family transcriptional regulator [Sphingomonas trueperi]|uniref:LysR family transcriptional regulator n=1 Tax=Sphingomonas trueperi TaxID=53317 RepID=UPI000F135ABD